VPEGNEEMNNFKNIKLTDRDKYLLTAFAALCVVLAWLAWRIID